nr:sensor histidine kinase [Deinobacterium chartae]
MAPAVTIAYDASPLAAYLVLPALVGAYVVRGLNYRVRRTEEALRLERQRILQARAVAGAQESERARIARDLHDGPLQEVIAARRMVEAGLNERAVSVLAEAVQHLREAIYDVHPSVLQLGLPVALRALGARHASLEVHLQVSDPPPPLSEDQQLAVYRIVSEALSNVERHAQAHAAWIRLEAQGGELVVTVQDDGLGLPLKASGRGLGLVSMRERAEALGGQLSLSSNAQGTRVEARLPLRDTAIGLEA